MYIRQNFHIARTFSPRKKVEVVYTLSPSVTGENQLNLSFLWHLSRHQNKKKIKTKFRIAGTEVRYIFRIFFNGFLKHALATNCRNASSLRALVINFNTLGDQNESATEANKIGSTQITTPSPTSSTPCS